MVGQNESSADRNAGPLFSLRGELDAPYWTIRIVDQLFAVGTANLDARWMTAIEKDCGKRLIRFG
jgi:hypothetical protein